MTRFPRSLLFPLILVLICPVVRAEALETPAGRWEGAIDIPGQRLEIQVELAASEAGWSGAIDIPHQGLKGYSLVDVILEADQVSFRMPEIPGEPVFHGTLEDAGSIIRGTFTQGGAEFPFRLEFLGGETARDKALVALEGFDSFVEQALKDWEVPGLGIAVVLGEEPILVRGYGSRDVEQELPVTQDTLFAIGSTTKAFTALVLGTLVDEGRLDWKEPIRTYLPTFRLQDEFAMDRMTALDLLNHRSGLPRHDLMWYGSDWNRREIFDRLGHLEPSEDFRTEFQYNNLMFMTAGVLAEEITGQSWEDLVRERIFQPLGMDRANLSVERSRESQDYARPYQESATGALEPVPFRNIDAIGPAGSINASVRDMTRWVSLHLSDGQLGEQRIVTPTTLQSLHRPRMVATGLGSKPETPLACYASGWIVEPYRGHHRIWHNGGIDGFTAQAAFLPHDNLGLVILANRGGTPLPPLVELHLLDRLLGLEPREWSQEALAQQAGMEEGIEEAGKKEDPNRKKGTKPSHRLEEYAGQYQHPAYGSLTISRAERRKLHLDYNGLGSELEHFHYDVFWAVDPDSPLKGTRITFGLNHRGDVARVMISLEAQVEEILFDRLAPDSLRSPEFLGRLVGDFEVLGQSMKISLRGENALVISLAGREARELIPYRDLEFDLAGLEGYSIRFLMEDDVVTGAQLIQPDGVYVATVTEPQTAS